MAKVEILELKNSQFDELLSFLKKWGLDHPELGEGHILRWQRCHRFVAVYEGKIVGYIGQIPHDFKYGKSIDNKGIEHIGWGVTLVLDMSESSIRKQAGRGLLNRVEHNAPLLFSGVGIVPAIEEPYKRRGYEIRRDSTKMYARFVKPSKALRYLGKPVYYAPLIKLANLKYRSSTAIPYDKITEIDHFKPEWDSIWDSILYEQYEFFGIRNAEYLNYKLKQPNRRYHAYKHFDGGYIIFRIAQHRIKDLKLVKICDLVGTEAIKNDLLRISLKFLYEQHAYGIVALASSKDEKIYKKAGLYISKSYPIAMQEHIRAKMHVSFYDSDLDNLW
ncbi:MAG: hypothetical protein V3W18_09840 [candidate division Zixibacteria bacterium]